VKKSVIGVLALTDESKINQKGARICLHLSKRSKNYESVNYSLNRELAGVAYPLDPLPLLSDIAELACGQRDENPGVQLGGGTIDIKDGYHQFAQTAQSAKRVVTKLRVPKPEDVELAAPPPEPPPEKWDHSDAAYLHELVECVVGSLCPDELDSHAALGTTTSDFIKQALREARVKVGADVVYDQALFDSLELEDFKLEHYVENDQALRDGRSLDQILEERITPHRCKAGSQSELERRFQDLRGASGAVDVLCHGARDMMVSEFTPNGGAECSFGPSYLEKREICNDALLKLVKEGRAIAFSLDALLGTPFIYDLHCSPLIWAPKQDKC
jgi:hypothetical protein